MTNQPLLPFTVATLQEIERLGSVAPTSFCRSNPNPAKFNGYDFPAQTIFYFNIYGIHRDPKLWDRPELFNPDRFVDHGGKVFRSPQLMPFGSGKRACPGKNLARAELFLYFVTLFQRFRFEPTEAQVPSGDLEKGKVTGGRSVLTPSL